MHIVFLVHDFPIGGLATSGAANYVANMASTIARFGNTVTVITEAEKEESFEWNGVSVHKIRATRGFRNTGRPMPTYKKVAKNIWRSFWYNLEVYRLNKKQSVDIVQSVSSYGLALLRLRKIPYLVRVSEYPDLWVGANYENFDFLTCVKNKRFDNELQYYALKRADKVIVPSKLMQKLLLNKIGKEAIVVESPVVINELKEEKLNENNLVRGKYLVTYGALIRRKCIHILAEIIDEVLEKYPNMTYVLIGKDKELKCRNDFIKVSEYFKNKIIKNSDRFVYMGEISDRDRLFNIVKNSYACILPTRVDNLPNTVLESMALGKVIISSTSIEGTSVEQLIKDGYSGFLSEVDNKEELLKKIDIVMNLSEKEKYDIEQHAKERVKHLNPNKVYDTMANIYKELIYKK